MVSTSCIHLFHEVFSKYFEFTLASTIKLKNSTGVSLPSRIQFSISFNQIKYFAKIKVATPIMFPIQKSEIAD